jgi:hypothetical protein
LAIQKGYEVLDIIEGYDYEVGKYYPQTREGGLFVEYINTFLKLKADASGFPSWVRTPEDEEQYIETFYAREGVPLDRDAIRPNAAKRGQAKLCLNSLWSKLAEHQNRTQTKLISDPHELCTFLATAGVEVVNLFDSDTVVWAPWIYTTDEQVHTKSYQ